MLQGVLEIPVLHNSMRLALLIMREAYPGAESINHYKLLADMIGRAYKYAVFYKPYNLALQVARNCPLCSLEDIKKKSV